MTRAQAVRRLKRLVGNDVVVEVKDGISSPERRAKAKELSESLAAKERRLQEEYRARLEELLKQSGLDKLRHEIAVVRSKAGDAYAEGAHYRFSVSIRDTTELFGVREIAEGDTWEEVLRALDTGAAT